MANGNRPAILALVEKAWGSVGTAAPSEGSIPYGKSGSGSPTGESSGKSTKSPGRGYAGSRKGPRKPAPRPRRRP